MAIPVYKIKNWGKKGKVKKLIKALSDQDKLARWTAARALGEIGDAKAAEPLVGALGDNDLIVKKNASEALVKMDSSVVDALIKGLGDINPTVRGGAIETLKKIGSSAVDQLINAHKTDNENIRILTFKVLAGIEDPKSIDIMIKALEDNNPDLRLHAAGALSKIADNRAVDALTRALKDDNGTVRVYAASTLGKLGDAKSVNPLIEALDDKNEAVRGNAAEALGKIADHRAVAPLIKAITDQNKQVFKNVEEALVKIGTPAVDALIKTMDSKNPGARKKAADILGKLGWKPANDEYIIKYYIIKANFEEFVDIDTPAAGRPAVHTLIKILDEKQKGTRKKAAGILDKLGWQPTMDETGAKYYIAKGNIGKCTEIGTAAVDLLIKELEDKNENVRREAAKTLGEIGDANAVEPLVRALGDKSYSVCADSVAALVKIGAPAVEPLIKTLAGDGKKNHERAIESLGKIGDSRAVAPLIQALEDEDKYVRKSAVEALKKLYGSGNLSRENKKVILKLNGRKITAHRDVKIPPPKDCALPSRHADSPGLDFNL